MVSRCKNGLHRNCYSDAFNVCDHGHCTAARVMSSVLILLDPLFENHRNRQLIKDLIPSAQHDSTIEFIMRKSFSDSVFHFREFAAM